MRSDSRVSFLRPRALVRPGAGAFLALCALVGLAGGCRARDGSPEATARSVWRAALSGDAKAFASLYPTREELRALFEEATATRMSTAIEAAAAKLPTKPPPIVIAELRVEKEVDVAAGQGGLRKAVRVARLRMRVQMQGVGGAEGEDTMIVVRVGETWRALPKEAASLVP